MSESVIEVHLSDSVREEASAYAARDGVSLAEWLGSLAERHVREAYWEKQLSHSPQPGDAEALRELLARVPDNPPDPGDELPDGWTPR